MKKAVIPFILIFLFCLIPIIGNAETATDWFNLGYKYGDRAKNRGINADYERAIKCYTICIAKDSSYAAAYTNRGWCYEQLGKLDEAIKDSATGCNLGNQKGCDNYKIYMSKKPSAPSATDAAEEWFNKGYNATDNNKKIEYYTKAISLNPEYSYAYNNRGVAYDDLGKYDLAIADYTKAIKYDSKNKEAYNNRGHTYYNLGKYDQALADYTKAITLDPEYTTAYRNRGRAYGKLGQHDRAIADYNKIIQLEPNNADNYNGRGWNYYLMGQYGKALPDVEKALKIDPNHVNALDSRSNTLREMKRYDEAMADIERAIGIDPDYYFLYLTRGKLYEAKGMVEKARADYRLACDNGEDEACEALKKLSGSK